MVLQLFGAKFRQWHFTTLQGGKRDFVVPVPNAEVSGRRALRRAASLAVFSNLVKLLTNRTWHLLSKVPSVSFICLSICWFSLFGFKGIHHYWTYCFDCSRGRKSKHVRYGDLIPPTAAPSTFSGNFRLTFNRGSANSWGSVRAEPQPRFLPRCMPEQDSLALSPLDTCRYFEQVAGGAGRVLFLCYTALDSGCILQASTSMTDPITRLGLNSCNYPAGAAKLRFVYCTCIESLRLSSWSCGSVKRRPPVTHLRKKDRRCTLR